MTGTRGNPLIAAAPILALLALIYVTGIWADIQQYWEDVVYLTGQHIELVAISGSLGILAGVPVGIWLSRPSMRGAAESIMQIFNIGTTVPTLAVLALSMSVLGIGRQPAIFALFVATLLPILRNTYVGLLAVPPPLKEAATGMGMTPGQILLRVELPNALYVIFAGIRTALAVNVGTVPLAFLIGGGLGELIFTGIDLMDPGMLLAGAVPTAAGRAGRLCGGAGAVLADPARRQSASRLNRKTPKEH